MFGSVGPREARMLSVLSMDWTIMPASFSPNADCTRLELLGMIEVRMISGGGWAMRVTRAGYEARGDRLC